MSKEHQLSVKVDDDLWEMIEEEQEASAYDPSKSEVVRTALREYLMGNAKVSQAATAD